MRKKVFMLILVVATTLTNILNASVNKVEGNNLRVLELDKCSKTEKEASVSNETFSNFCQPETFYQATVKLLWEINKSEAKKVIEAGLKLYPESAFLGSYMCNLLEVGDNPGKVCKDLVRMSDTYPENLEFAEKAGRYSDYMQDKEGAVKYYVRAFELGSKNLLVAYNGGFLLSRKGLEIQAKADNEKTDSGYNNLFKQALGCYKKSLPLFKRALEINPDAVELNQVIQDIEKMIEVNKFL